MYALRHLRQVVVRNLHIVEAIPLRVDIAEVVLRIAVVIVAVLRIVLPLRVVVAPLIVAEVPLIAEVSLIVEVPLIVVVGAIHEADSFLGLLYRPLGNNFDYEESCFSLGNTACIGCYGAGAEHIGSTS